MDYQFDVKRVNDWKSHLITEGYVVVTGILTQPEIEQGLSMFLEQFGNDGHDGFIDDVNFSYSSFAWFCRTHPNVLAIYKEIYGLSSVTDLITAIDRGSAISNRLSPDLDEATRFWLHVDYPLFNSAENRDEPVPEIYQSFLSFVDSGGPTAPGFRVIPRSCNKTYHDRVLSDNADKIKVSNSEDTYWLLSPAFTGEIKDTVISIVSPAGSLTLWKSGMVHDNTTGVYHVDPKSEGSANPLARLVVYLCYAPRFWATEEELTLRRKIYQRKQITTHWPVRFIGLHDDTICQWKHRKIITQFPIIQFLIPFK